MRWRMKYPAVDDLVAPRGTLDLIWAGAADSGRVDYAAARPWIPAPARIAAAGRTRSRASRARCAKTLTAGIPEMATIIVNEFPDGLARGSRGGAPTPAAQISIVAREFAANDTTLRFSRGCTGERGRRPVLRPARNPARAFEFAGARRPMVRRHPRALPGPTVRANSRRQVPDRVSRVSVKMIRGTFGLEFLFINARGPARSARR
jgi:hypothetical protein